ncbi:MAG: hypothetical protein MK538_16045, partial [Planctomycetes bacterium]|nr:hypothetical protein [Planctomycetota bacterium]
MSQITSAVAAFLLLSIFAQSATLQAELVSLEVIESGPFADGEPFGTTGPYTYLRGVARFEVDPGHELNRVIVDVENVPKNERGKVEFEADVSILTPSDPSKGNRALLYGVNNRGRKNALGFFNEAQRTNAPRTLEHAGDG